MDSYKYPKLSILVHVHKINTPALFNELLIHVLILTNEKSQKCKKSFIFFTQSKLQTFLWFTWALDEYSLTCGSS